MANGGLTAKEFWRLSPDERMKRCGELSEHEAFLMRITDPSLPISPPCNECKHYIGRAKCKAFPDGMESNHVMVVMQDQSTDCGNGFHFEKREDT